MPKNYFYYTENNICPGCHVRPRGIKTGVLCQVCYEKRKFKVANRKANNLCHTCGSPCAAGRTRCPVCLAKETRGTQQRRQSRMISNLCLSCGNPVTDEHKLCGNCRTKDSELRKSLRLDRLSKSLCTSCGRELTDKNYHQCETCRTKATKKVTERYHERRKQGICTNCQQPIEPDSPAQTLCVTCYNINRKHRIASNSRQRYGGNLGFVMERDGCCVVCGKLTSLVCHHMDSDTSHNDPTNLVILCRKCHLLVTMWIECSDKQSMLNFLLKNYPINDSEF